MTSDATRKRIAVLVGAALLFSFGAVAADDELGVGTEAITGHTTYVEMGTLGFDKCLAAIAGLVKQRVVWFNGAELFRRSAAGSGLWVYATERLEENWVPLAPSDPSEAKLIDTGNRFRFQDMSHSNIMWEVYELQQVDPAITQIAGSPSDPPVEPLPPESILRYVYAVRIADEDLDDETTVNPSFLKYNFVNIVDTCKFRSERYAPIEHDPNDDPQPNPACASGGGRSPAGTGECTDMHHEPDTQTHTHDEYEVLLFVGDEPDIINPTVDSGEGPQTPGVTEGGA